MNEVLITARLMAIENSLREGFVEVNQKLVGVNQRLDRVNGRLDKHADSINTLKPEVSGHEVQLKNLNREVFDRPRRQVDAKDDLRPITVRDLRTVVLGASVVLGAIAALMKYGPWIIKMISGGGGEP